VPIYRNSDFAYPHIKNFNELTECAKKIVNGEFLIYAQNRDKLVEELRFRIWREYIDPTSPPYKMSPSSPLINYDWALTRNNNVYYPSLRIISDTKDGKTTTVDNLSEEQSKLSERYTFYYADLPKDTYKKFYEYIRTLDNTKSIGRYSPTTPVKQNSSFGR